MLRLADVKQRLEQTRVKRAGGECVTLRQDRNRVMAMQTLLVTGDNAEITDTRIGLELRTKRARRVLDENRVGSV